MPNISMNPRARYVTCRAFDTPMCGPLTDRKIAKYQKAGWYTPTGHVKPEKRKKAKTAHILKKLLNKYT